MHDRIEPVHEEDIHLAARLADDHLGLSARDLVHAAVMQRWGTDRIVLSDADFDRLPGIIRLDPVYIAEWSGSVLDYSDRSSCAFS